MKTVNLALFSLSFFVSDFHWPLICQKIKWLQLSIINMYAEDRDRLFEEDYDNPEPVSMLKNLSNTLRNTHKTSYSISSWIPKKQSKLKLRHKPQQPNPSPSSYQTIKTEPESLTRPGMFYTKRLKTTSTLPQFKSLNKKKTDTHTNSFLITKRPKMTRELSDLCSMDVQSKEFKLKLLINNISTLRVKEARMAEVLTVHLDRKSIKKRLSMFRQHSTLFSDL